MPLAWLATDPAGVTTASPKPHSILHRWTVMPVERRVALPGRAWEGTMATAIAALVG